VLLAICVFIGVLSSAPITYAETITVSHKIYVRAEVLPTVTVIVDSKHQIKSVMSNSRQDVVPSIYINSVTDANKLPFDKRIYAEYKRLVPAESLRIGVIYEQKQPQIGAMSKNLSFASFKNANSLIAIK